MKKRLVSLLIVACMIFSMLPFSAVTAFAEESASNKCGDNLTWSYDENTQTLTISGSGPMYNYSEGAPWRSDFVKSAQIGEGVTTIGDYAFMMSDLTSITIPDSVTAIGESAFDESTSLTSVTIPGSVTTIGKNAFQECSGLVSVTISEGVKEIGERAFYNCNKLTSINIPGSVTTIGKSAFEECDGLASVTISDGVKEIGAGAFSECSGLSSINIPNSVTEIGTGAFANSGLTSIEIPNSITKIGGSVFYDCTSLRSVTIPNSVTEIDDYAFYGCENISRLYIPGSVKRIGNGAFYCCIRVRSIELGDGVTTIGDEAFLSCWGLESIDIPDSVTTVGTDAFNGCMYGGYYYPWELPSGKQDFHYSGSKRQWDELTKDASAPVTDQYGTAIKYEYDKKDVQLKNATGRSVDVKTDSSESEVKIDADGRFVVPKGCTMQLTVTNPGEKDYYKWRADNISVTTEKSGCTIDVGSTDDVMVVELTATNLEDDSKNWESVAVVDGTLTKAESDKKDITEEVVSTKDQLNYKVPAGAKVTVKANDAPEGMKFKMWVFSNYDNATVETDPNDDPNNAIYSNEMTFTVPVGGVTVSAMYEGDSKNWENVAVVDGTLTKAESNENDITEEVISAKEQLNYKVPAGAKVTVKANDAPEGMKFKMWVFSNYDKAIAEIDPNSDPDNAIYSNEMTFTVPVGGVTVSAMYEDASIDDGGSDIIGSVVIGAAVVAGGAALGYQAYKLGTDLLGDLWGLPYFPSNRSALALMLWEDAGKPMPESDILYPDVGWEEQDMDLQHAARWAMEHELIPDKNDKDADLTPEEVKFFPNDPVSKYNVLKAWKKAQELKKNA